MGWKPMLREKNRPSVSRARRASTINGAAARLALQTRNWMTSRDRQGAVWNGEERSLTVAARCLCAHDEPSTITGGAARLALQTRNIVLKILASQSEMQKKFFRATIFHFR